MRRIALALLIAFARLATALEPDNLLLITNKNQPQGRQLAEFYAAQRKLPDHRILDLDLPPGEEISFDAYENQVIPVVRDFLKTNNLQSKVTCLVTLYGTPLKIAARQSSPADQAEVTALNKELKATLDQIAATVTDVEAIAREVDRTFLAGADTTLPGLLARDRAARSALMKYASSLKDQRQLDAIEARGQPLIARLVGAAPMMQHRMQSLLAIAQRWTPDQKREAERLRDELAQTRDQYETLLAHRADPKARAQLRPFVKQQFGLIEHARLLEGMLNYFATEATGAAFDSELSLVAWNFYPRSKSIPNPFRYQAPHAELPPTYMTMRLDAPKAPMVHDIIRACITAETDGLPGKVVIDSGGHLSIDSKSPFYGAFDQTLRNMAEIVRTKTHLPLIFDEKREVIPANSIKEPVAIYCGWYALRTYTPACKFSPGGVGYHVASLELTTLHVDNPREWCAGLLNDGIAATLGAVNEPYLNAFPRPDEFFPLLFTGKLTLAEVYWKTNPLVSWQIAMIGDPLYNPYKTHPPPPPDALPAPLQEALK
jgi:uncharacterized protein (TIGR03790 family)